MSSRIGKELITRVTQGSKRTNLWQYEPDLSISSVIVPYIGDSLVEKATTHALNRMDKVTQYGMVVAMMNQFGLLGDSHKIITAMGAKVQLQTGSRYEPAAHLVPGWALVNSRPVEAFVPPPSTLLRMTVAGITGATDKVPLVINETDSLREMKGEINGMTRWMMQLAANAPSETDLTFQQLENAFEMQLRPLYIQAADRSEEYLLDRLRSMKHSPEQEEKLEQKLSIVQLSREIALGYSPPLLNPSEFKGQKQMLESIIFDEDRV